MLNMLSEEKPDDREDDDSFDGCDATEVDETDDVVPADCSSSSFRRLRLHQGTIQKHQTTGTIPRKDKLNPVAARVARTSVFDSGSP